MNRTTPWDKTAPANAFELADSEYQDFRPSYPNRSVYQALGTNPADGLHVVDMGAGTGKFTRKALAAGARVWAVEPALAMRAQLRGLTGANENLTIVDGSAEQSGLPRAIADVVTYAQSWHWVNKAEALQEAARILRPGGHVAIIFNQMDVSIPWVHRLTRIMRSGDIHTPNKPPRVGEGWANPTMQKTEFLAHLDIAGVKALARTRSSYLKSTESNRARMQANLQWYLSEHLGYSNEDLIEIPYYTLVWKTHPAIN